MAFRVFLPVIKRSTRLPIGVVHRQPILLSPHSSHLGSLKIQSHTQAAQALVLLVPLLTWSSHFYCYTYYLLPLSPRDFLKVSISLNSSPPASYHSSMPRLRLSPKTNASRRWRKGFHVEKQTYIEMQLFKTKGYLIIN